MLHIMVHQSVLFRFDLRRCKWSSCFVLKVTQVWIQSIWSPDDKRLKCRGKEDEWNDLTTLNDMFIEHFSPCLVDTIGTGSWRRGGYYFENATGESRICMVQPVNYNGIWHTLVARNSFFGCILLIRFCRTLQWFVLNCNFFMMSKWSFYKNCFILTAKKVVNLHHSQCINMN